VDVDEVYPTEDLWTDLIHDEMMTQPLSMNCDISEWITWTTHDRDVQREQVVRDHFEEGRELPHRRLPVLGRVHEQPLGMQTTLVKDLSDNRMVVTSGLMYFVYSEIAAA
jgi:hypothetical protein